MKQLLIRVVLTLVYCFIGMKLALPISYYIQSDLYSYMSVKDYVLNAPESVMAGAQFGSWELYRNTAIVSVITMVIVGNLLEKIIFRNKKAK